MQFHWSVTGSTLRAARPFRLFPLNRRLLLDYLRDEPAGQVRRHRAA